MLQHKSNTVRIMSLSVNEAESEEIHCIGVPVLIITADLNLFSTKDLYQKCSVLLAGSIPNLPGNCIYDFLYVKWIDIMQSFQYS